MSAIGLNIFEITVGIKKYKSIIKKKRKNHDKIILLAKNKLNNFIMIFFSVNNVLKEYNNIKKPIENPNNS